MAKIRLFLLFVHVPCFAERGGKFRLHLMGRGDAQWWRWLQPVPVPSTLKREALCLSETLLPAYQTTRCHNPEELQY